MRAPRAARHPEALLGAGRPSALECRCQGRAQPPVLAERPSATPPERSRPSSRQPTYAAARRRPGTLNVPGPGAGLGRGPGTGLGRGSHAGPGRAGLRPGSSWLSVHLEFQSNRFTWAGACSTYDAAGSRSCPPKVFGAVSPAVSRARPRMGFWRSCGRNAPRSARAGPWPCGPEARPWAAGRGSGSRSPNRSGPTGRPPRSACRTSK